MAHGQQPLAFYNAHYRNTCYLPLLIFEGLSGALVGAVLRPGKRPTGAENAMILERVLKLIRSHFPDTHILVRGDGHFSNPEWMRLRQVKQYKDRIILHLPSACAVKHLLHRVTERLFLCKP